MVACARNESIADHAIAGATLWLRGGHDGASPMLQPEALEHRCGLALFCSERRNITATQTLPAMFRNHTQTRGRRDNARMGRRVAIVAASISYSAIPSRPLVLLCACQVRQLIYREPWHKSHNSPPNTHPTRIQTPATHLIPNLNAFKRKPQGTYTNTKYQIPTSRVHDYAKAACRSNLRLAWDLPSHRRRKGTPLHDGPREGGKPRCR